MEEEINLLDYYKVIKKRYKIILLIFLAAVITTTIVSFMLPKIYRAETSIYVLKAADQPLAALASRLEVPFVASFLGISAGHADYLIALLKSDTLTYEVINKLDLKNNKVFLGKKVNKEELTREKLIKKLKDVTKITDDKKGKITVQVELTSPELAATVANTYIKILRGSIYSHAQKNVEFLEKQLNRVKVDLAKAENNLKNFQKKNKTIALDKEASALVESFVELQSQDIANQIALNQTDRLLKTAGSIEQLSELQTQRVALQTKCEGLKKALREIENEFTKLPAQAFQLAQLTREVKLQNILYELFIQQYEMAKIRQQQEDIDFQILDKAYPPEKPVKPKKRLNVMIAAVLSLFIGIFLVFFLEYVENVKEREIRGKG